MSRPPDPAIEARYARLLSLAVHEFRTPASVVGGYLRMLQRDAESPLSERQRRMVDEAEKSCARLVALIAELSEISKLDAGSLALAEQPFDLFQLVREVASGVHEAEDRGVRLEVRGPAAGAQTRGDITRLGNALSAVFRAVLREQPASTIVAADIRQGHPGLSASLAAAPVIVVARDNDVQAAYEAAPADFDEKRGGMGLALPIARRVFEQHGGRLWSPSGPEGADVARTAILIALPLRDTRSAPSSPSSSSSSGSGVRP